MATRTAAEVRDEQKHTFNVFFAECPTRNVLATIGDKWTALIVCALRQGPRRHGELRTAIAGVSQKMLTQTLRTLERDGLVRRTVTPSVPVRVDYELTALGASLVPVMEGLRHWSEANMAEILTARGEYDAQEHAGS